jgi:hypothetical protein
MIFERFLIVDLFSAAKSTLKRFTKITKKKWA